MSDSVERIWSGWRAEYVQQASASRHTDSCVFCELLSCGEPDECTNIVWKSDTVAAILNAYPYGVGHVLVMPTDHIGELEDLQTEVSTDLWLGVQAAITAIKKAYHPHGVNVGLNLGEGSGAGIPAHLHAHVLPRWKADTNFMTSVANARVLPESLDATWQKLRETWPA